MAETSKATNVTKTTPAKTTTAPAPAEPARTESTPAERPGGVQAYDFAPDFDRAKKGDSTDAGNLATEGDVLGSTAVPGVDVKAQDEAIKEAGSTDPADHVIDAGNFHDPALQGAGTILPGGGYGPPLPDPQVQRAQADDEYQVK